MESATERARVLTSKTVRGVLRLPGVTPGLQALSLRELLPLAMWRRLPVASPVAVPMPDGSHFRFVGAQRDERAYFWAGLAWREGTTAHAFLALARNARTVLDVGANVGIYSLMAMVANPAARVVAFEPAPAARALLQENIRINDFGSRCVVRESAASDIAGVAPFHVPDHIGAEVMASLDPKGFRGITGTLISVPTERVDDALDDLALAGTVDLVKIDVEHFEHLVLRGMERTLTGPRPAIVFEAWADGPFETVGTILREHDYELYGLLAEGLRPVARIPEAFGNLLALPAGRRPPTLPPTPRPLGRRRRGLG